ncbi:hypothetical protein FSARC_10616 [Fusarium sarcochroum]|uniref:Uncharacterized protein n=1 Tax=Fusarium sarcochroum TaxID=1208366 RepID=A0A8H4X3P3_9HYPO|nr:hypothetical protein FSARC_10616 [Fusarium sarcochroum]
MTTPPSSLRASPRKILSESSDTRSLTSSNFAQLLSRFEVLDSVSSAGNSSPVSSKNKPVSAAKFPSIAGQSSIKPLKQSSQGSTRTRERSSTESSRFSPGRFIPSSQASPRPRRARTFGTKSPVLPSNNASSKSRQKSVAERRMMFETVGQKEGESAACLSASAETRLIKYTGMSSPPRTSTFSRSTSKLAHSKSWQSIKSRRSTPGSQTNNAVTSQNPTSGNRDSASNAFSPSSRVVPSPRSLIASDDPFGTWRSPLNRPDDSWTSFKRSSFLVPAPDASPSYIKSQYVEMSPQTFQTVSTSQVNLDPVLDDDFIEKHNVSIEETQRHGWVRSARKIASSLSNTVSAGSSSLRGRSRGSQDASIQAPSSLGALMSFKLTRANVPGRSKLPRSRISSLRKKFDQPKDQSPASIPPPNTKRRESTFAKDEAPSSPSRIPLLKPSMSSDSGELNAPTFRSKSHASHLSQKSIDLPQTPVSRRNTEKHISPLKQKIDLFESLDRQGPASELSQSTVGKTKSSIKLSKRKNSIIGPLRDFKGTFRRISTFRRRTPSEWSTTSSRDIDAFQRKSSDNNPVVGYEQAAVSAATTAAADADEPPSPHTVDAIPEKPVLSQTFLTNEISPLVLDKPLSLPSASIARTGFNIDGEAGLSVAPPPLFAESHRRFSRTKQAPSRTANRFSLPDVEKEIELIELLENDRQRILGSSPWISKARCDLEQPRPVRANELRRLVGLCREKVRKTSGGRSE